MSGLLFADPPSFVIATAAGHVPGPAPLAIQQHLVEPLVVAYDPDGTLYYGTAHQIWRLNADGTMTLIAGNGGSDVSQLGDGGLATGACLGWVSGVAIDVRHNVYISDVYGYEVRKVTADGVINRFAGTGARPNYGDGSNAGGSTAAVRVAMVPGSLAADGMNLYVTDTATASVLAFPFDGRSSRVVAGNRGNATAGDGGSAVNASLFYPGTLALGNSVLYINEANGARIRQVVFRTGVITTLVELAKTYLIDNGNPGLAADSNGTLYLQRGNTIARLFPGGYLELWAGGGASPPGDPGPALQASLLKPACLAINPIDHDLSLADSSGNVIQTVDGSTGNLQAVAGFVHFAGDDGPAALAVFNGMESVVANSEGNLFVADVGNNRIRRIDSAGMVTTVAGTGIAGFSGDGGPATSANLNLGHRPPFANNLAIDTVGNLYVSDNGNGRIRKIDTSGTITTVAGGGVAPFARSGIATSMTLQPGPIAVDGSGNLYFGQVQSGVAPAIPTVYKIEPRGQISAYAGGPATGNITESGPAILTPIGYAYCLLMDGAGVLYICDSANNRVRKVTPDGMMTTLAGNGGVPGAAPHSGVPAAVAIGPPTGVAIDGTGNVYIYALRQIWEIDATGTLQLFAGDSAMPVTPSGDGGYISQATFASVTGMTFDASGNLFVADAGTYLRQAMPVGSNGPPPIILSGGIVGAGASNPPVQAVSPGAIVSIYGSNFSPPGAQRLLQGTDLLSGKLPTNLAGICVSFGGIGASITSVFSNQINVQVPELPPGPVTVRVTANCGGTSPIAGNVSAVAVEKTSPEFYSSTDSASGKNYVAAYNSSGTFTTGSMVEAFGTGWGATAPAIAPGSLPAAAAQLASTPGLTLGGVAIPAENIVYAGVSPCCAGLYQVDFTIPPGVAKGDQPLIITVDGISSPASAFLPVQ
jgi:uncharacterized protein (TIGR03437 family)